MMSTDPDTFLVEGLTMDQSKYHSARADILAFPHMSRKDEQLLQTVLNNMSQGVLMFDAGNAANFLQPTLYRIVRTFPGSR